MVDKKDLSVSLPLARAFLRGSFQHMLVAVLVPVMAALMVVVANLRHFSGNLLLVVWYGGLAMGTPFLFHEIVLLIAYPLVQRSRAKSEIETSLSGDLLSAVICTDLIILCLVLAVPYLFKIQAPTIDPGTGWWYAVGCLYPSLYGVYLLGRCLQQVSETPRRVATPAPTWPPQSLDQHVTVLPPPRPVSEMSQQPETGTHTVLEPTPLVVSPRPIAHGKDSRGIAPNQPLPGLQVYVTVVVASMIYATTAFLGVRLGWGGTFCIGLVSIGVGRVAGKISAKWGTDAGYL